MNQLKNVVNRTNVVKNPKTNFNACDDSFQIIVTSHILAAAMEVLGMSNLDDTPSEDVLPSPDLIWMETDEVRKGFLQDITMLIAKRFIGISYNTPVNASTSDGVHDYSRHLLTIGCLYAEIRDAVKEGDGNRVLQCWRYLLPIFHHAGRRNYTIEAFTLLFQHDYSLPPKLVEQLIWSRFVNTRGVQGRNIPLDLHQEHLNRVCKTCIENLGANKRGEAVVRCSKIVGTIDAVLTGFDDNNSVSVTSGSHKNPSWEEDLRLLTKELLQSEVFKVIPGRQHQSFKRPTNIIHSKPKQHIVDWIVSHIPR